MSSRGQVGLVSRMLASEFEDITGQVNGMKQNEKNHFRLFFSQFRLHRVYFKLILLNP